MVQALNMGISSGLNTSAKQTQTIAPHILQALKIIQKPAAELRQEIFQKLMSNPALELVSDSNRELQLSTDQLLNGSRGVDDQGGMLDKDDLSGNYDGILFEKPVSAELQKIETRKNKTEKEIKVEERSEYLFEPELRYDSSYAKNYSENSREFNGKDFILDNLSVEKNLHDFLMHQLAMTDSDPKVRQTAEIIIGNIDERGYLTLDTKDFKAEIVKIDNGRAFIQEAVKVVQSFDPPGVGARDLQECLLLQLERIGKEGSLEWKIIKDCLNELSNKKFALIAKKLKVKIAEIQSAFENIATLNPIPGKEFQNLQPYDYIIADLIISKEHTSGNYIVEMNENSIPKLRISQSYNEILAKNKNKESVKEYFKEKIREGKFFLQQINNRKKTLLKIAKAIVKRQKAFLDFGKGELKPMLMKEIAEEIGMHESTISRAISGKFIQTPRGVFPMKILFSSGKYDNHLTNFSNHSIKEKIREIIKNEDPHKPFSDTKIVNILNQQDIKIARRTVAKYRTELKILPANLRKL